MGRTDGESHAALSSSSKRSTNNGVERKVLVGVRHQDTVVCSARISFSSSGLYSIELTLGSQVGLHSLSIRSGSVVDVLSGPVGSDE